MRISDWSSDVCSSDLDAERPVDDDRGGRHPLFERGRIDDRLDRRSRLTHRLRRAVERLDTRIEAALHREDAPGIGLLDDHAARYRGDAAQRPRSEEHTSELQSLMRISYAVFCLKKKK